MIAVDSVEVPVALKLYLIPNVKKIKNSFDGCHERCRSKQLESCAVVVKYKATAASAFPTMHPDTGVQPFRIR